ncbi:hypothetical protein Chor_004903 [Crotalus horridus]
MKLSTQAYCKMVLHGAKYPHCAVNGLLVAEKQPPPPPQRGRERESPAQALLIDSWCRENSYVIAGYYQANERVKDASPNLLAEKVASRIAENFSDTALIMVDNTKFTMKCLKPAVHVYEHHENKWRCRDPHIRSYETLVDFDNHLDDIRNDWTNPEINKAVLHLC